jgi:phospholipid/cholesterol/gamma-HCH transport system ATP-binding protein
MAGGPLRVSDSAVEEAAVALRAVCKSFRGVPVLDQLDLTVQPGETFTVLGGSGSGKSVCLKHMIGLLRPDSGSIHVAGHAMGQAPESRWVALRRQIGMVFQGAALFDSQSVYENVAFPIREHERWPETQVRERVAACLEQVGLAGSEALFPAELSGGMRKRVGVARAIALHPRLILYDEPTTGLDPGNSRRIGELIQQLQRDMRVTAVVVTHDLELCFRISDRVALLRAGRLRAQGPAAEMRAGDDPEMRAFLGGEEPPGALVGAADPA